MRTAGAVPVSETLAIPALPFRRKGARWAVGLALLLALVMAGVLAHRQALGVFLDDTARRGDTTLRLAVATLQGQLARFERLPGLLARDALLRAMARNPHNPALIAAVNAQLKSVAAAIGASDLYYMDASGMTRAASNHDLETSFVGGNFAFRPYFLDAMEGGEGRFFALGTTSRKRGYYFGAPVIDRGVVLGVMVLKVDLDEIENTWRGGDDAIVVTDPEGIVFLSSRPDWLFSGMEPLDAARLARTAETRRYADAILRPLPVRGIVDRAGHRVLVMGETGGDRHWLKRVEPMPAADWSVTVMADTAPAERQALTVAVAVVLGLGLAAAGGLLLWQRRIRLRDRLAMQAAAQAELEIRVTERTAELAAARDRLQAEVAERIAAETSLRQAQDSLVQAGKLAALGQMSAALSHEFNQPLAAARNYAENAQVLIERDRVADARGNIERILGLIDRMAAISRHLRAFARKPGQKLGSVDLAETVAAALEIAGPRLRAAGATVKVDLPAHLPAVQAGPVRLQQVLVNLLTNAADAVEDAANRTLVIGAEPTPTGARLWLRDHGPGLAPGVAERVFDPFFSTKGPGKGLGLGLSISYNIVKDFGGDLTAGNAPDGGAVFTLDLPAAEPAEQAA
jgi:two-component system, NtrC family, C4-dicarboxylate transport sensor histidine kinase DctB